MLYDFQTTKESIIYIYNYDGYIHASWVADNEGRIISFEVIPENYPAGSYKIWENEAKYVEAIEEVDWIMNEFLNMSDCQINDELEVLIKAIERYREK